jgi:hypothetical protein
MWRDENSGMLVVGMKISMTIMENSTEFPQKVKNKTIS